MAAIFCYQEGIIWSCTRLGVGRGSVGSLRVILSRRSDKRDGEKQGLW